jgi:predicted chitinase
MLTDDSLKQIMPNLSDAKRSAYVPHLQSAMKEFEIVSPLREAAFLAQIAHESGEFRWMEEIWGPTATQKRYEPPTELAAQLGNTELGDGKRFKGRGPIQITGRDNYRRFGDLLGLDLVSNPEAAAAPEVGFRIAGLYWKRRGLNELADVGDFEKITRRINGGLNGQSDRLKYYARAKEVFGVASVRGTRSPVSRSLEIADTMFHRGFEAIRAARARKRRTKTSKDRSRTSVKRSERKAKEENCDKKTRRVPMK